MTAQVKNRFKILSTYLGQDKAGQAMLKDLKDAVNVLRKKASVATEAATDAEAGRAAAVDRAKESDSALKEARQELRQVRGEVRRLTQLVESKPVEVTAPAAELCGTMKSVVKKLRREMRYCPVAKEGIEFHNDRVSVWDRESISVGWSHAALWRLGATVAVLAAMTGTAFVTTKLRANSVEDRNADNGVGRQMMQWFRHNIDWKPDAGTRLYEADGV